MICRSTFRATTGMTILSTALICLSILLAAAAPGHADDRTFPVFDAIRANVAFWEKIYSQYAITDAVIHDTEDLSKVYEVLPLLADNLPGAARINSAAEKLGIEKYEKILKKLATSSPTTNDEKRVAAMFPGPNSRRQMARAAENVRCQQGLRERFYAGVLSSASYLREIKKIFRAHRLPEELAYIPHVESSFNTKAYSKHGAAGIWQFTRATGKQYLTIDYVVDERLDPIAATHAAAKYLGKSYRLLHDWPLAITSYNYGLAGAKRAQEEHGNYEAIYSNYNKGYFKFASKNFYPEFLAALKVAQRLEKQKGFQLTRGTQFQYYRLPAYTSLGGLAKHLQLNPSLLMELNPALRPPIQTGEKNVPKGYNLRLPAGQAIDSRIATVPKALFASGQKQSVFHKVQSGETASGIARRYGISLQELQKANNLDNLATIFVRQKLRIPGKSSGATTKLTQKDITQKSIQPVLFAYKKTRPSSPGVDNLPQKDPAVYNVFNRTRKGSKDYGTITVQSEETIDLYAQWLKEPVENLYTLNLLPPGSQLSPGQRLNLVFTKVSANNFEDKRLDFLQETEEDFFSAYTVIGQQTYKIIHGDTLWNLCYNKFDIPLWLLERYNSSINLTNLKVSQELVIPIIQSI